MDGHPDASKHPGSAGPPAPEASPWVPAGAEVRPAPPAAAEPTAGPSQWLETRVEPSHAPSEWLADGARASEQERLAALAYSRELCDPSYADAAAGAAVASFEQAAGHQTFLQVTRATAAAHARPPGSSHSAGWRSRVVEALGAEHDVGCRTMPGLLARRADGELGNGEAAAADEHLRSCLRCQALELRFARAERAYAAVTAAASATPAPADPPAETIQDDPPAVGTVARRSLGLPLLAVLGAAVAVAAVILILSGGSSRQSGVRASTSPAVSTPTVTATHAAATPVGHRAARRRGHAKKRTRHPKAAAPAAAVIAAATPVTTSTTTSQTTSVAVVTPTPTAAPPSTSAASGSSGSGSGASSSPSFVQQGGSLGAQSAPQQPIGSGGRH